MSTKIEWVKNRDGSAGETWNPVRGCSLTSPGCKNCYAMKFAHRFSGKGGRYEGLTELGPNGPRWNGTVRLVPDHLDKPLRWRKPRAVFVNSMSDLFHKDVPNEYIAAVFGVMAATPQHTYQILTKRPDRMVEWFQWLDDHEDGVSGYPSRLQLLGRYLSPMISHDFGITGIEWPLPNVWIGVSVENQETADERIPLLLQVPAAVHWISAEPLLGPVDLCGGAFGPNWLEGWGVEPAHATGCDGSCVACPEAVKVRTNKLDWIVAGGESGPGARPMQLKWVRDIVSQCSDARVACFVKQLGRDPRHDHTDEDHTAPGISAGGRLILNSSKGGDPSEWPEDLRVREMPQ